MTEIDDDMVRLCVQQACKDFYRSSITKGVLGQTEKAELNDVVSKEETPLEKEEQKHVPKEMIIKGMTAGCTVSMNFWNDIPKNISKLTFTDSTIDQEALGDLGLHLMTNECMINELTLDGIDLSKKKFMCCLPPSTRVKKLWLRFCRLGDAGVDQISETLQCQGDDFCNKGETRTLQLLNLDCNGITCAGAKTLAQVLRTNRSLRILSLAKNVIKDEGALALVNVLSKFALTEEDLKWKNTRELRRTIILEYLMDILSLSPENHLDNVQHVSNLDFQDHNKAFRTSENLKEKAENILKKQSHPYLTGKLFKNGSDLYCLGNFKIIYLNISYNRFPENVIKVIEHMIQYQQKICLIGEGLLSIKIEGFDKKLTENIYKLMDVVQKEKGRNFII